MKLALDADGRRRARRLLAEALAHGRGRTGSTGRQMLEVIAASAVGAPLRAATRRGRWWRPTTRRTFVREPDGQGPAASCSGVRESRPALPVPVAGAGAASRVQGCIGAGMGELDFMAFCVPRLQREAGQIEALPSCAAEIDVS